MTVPTPRRRRISVSQETSADTSPVELDLGDGVEAEVVEHIGGKTVMYNATAKHAVKTNETQNEDQNFESDLESEVESYQETPYRELPKSKLDVMFNDLSDIVNSGNYDNFTARLQRLQDQIGDNFNIPCRDLMDGGYIRFTTQDRFAFIPEIQKVNNNSGGRFYIYIYDAQQQEVRVPHANPRFPTRIDYIPIAFEMTISNPIAQELQPINNNNGHFENDPMFMLIQQMRAESNQFKEMFLQTLNQRPEKSIIEVAREQMVINKIINSETKTTFDPNEFMQTVMMQGSMINGFGEMFQKMLMREPTAVAEPTAWDRVMQLADHPVAGQIVNKVLEVGEAIAATKLGQPGEVVTTQENPEQQSPQETQAPPVENPMQELLDEVIAELESENPLDATNETIKELQTDFPKEYGMLKMMCKGLDTFDEAFGTLLESTVQIQPYPFSEYLDFKAMELAGKGVYIVNEKGEKMKVRLNEFYEYVRTT